MLNICQTWSSFSWNSLLKHDNDNMLQKCCSGQICLVHGIFKLPYQIWHQWLVWNLANWPKIDVGKNMMMRANNVGKYLMKWVSWTSYSAIKPLDKPKLPSYMRYFLLFSRILSILLKFTGVSLQKIQRYSSVNYCINRWLWLFTIAWGCLCWIIFTRDQNI